MVLSLFRNVVVIKDHEVPISSLLSILIKEVFPNDVLWISRFAKCVILLIPEDNESLLLAVSK